MSKIISLAILLLTLTLIATSSPNLINCVCPDANCQVVTVQYNTNSSSFNITMNIVATSKLIVQQQECQSCGYQLDYVTANFKNDTLLKYVDKTASPAVTSSSMVVGGNVNQCFTFQVLSAGRALIPFDYYQISDKLTSSQKSIVEVNIINDPTVKTVIPIALSDTQVLTLNNYQATLTVISADGGYLKTIYKMIFIMLVLFFN